MSAAEVTAASIGSQVPRRGNAFTRWLGRLILRLTAFRLVGEFPNVSKLIILGAPHTSNYDGLVGLGAMMTLSVDLRAMVKDNAFQGPWAGFFKWLGGMPINRREAKGVVEQTVQAFQDNPKMVLVIAPEGTRKAAEKWKTGFYHAAAGAQVPILCAALNYTRRELCFTPLVHPSGDFARDWPQILGRYKDSVPRHPPRMSKPICDLQGKAWQPYKG